MTKHVFYQHFCPSEDRDVQKEHVYIIVLKLFSGTKAMTR